MVDISKTILAPIIAVICMAAQLVFGVDINEEVQDQLITAIINLSAVIVTIYGIFKNYKKISDK